MPRLTALFAATTLIAAIAAGNFWWQLHADRELIAQLRQEASRSQATAMQIASQTSRAGELSLKQADAAPIAGPAAAATATTHSTGPTTPVAYSVTPRSATDVVGSSLKLNQLQQRFPGVAKALGLSAEDAEAFYDMLMKHEADLNASLMRLQQANSGPIDMQAVQRMQTEIEKTQATEIAAQLGPTRLRQWQEYQTTVDARRRVNELTMMLASSSPLTEAQSGPLLATIIAEQKRRADDERLRSPQSDDPRMQLEFEEQNLQARVESNRRTADAARSFMNAEQIALLQDAMIRANERARAALQSRREKLDGQP